MSRFKRSLVKLGVLASLLVSLSPAVAGAASIGVGVGSAKIVVDDPVKPGLSYNLPSISVFNNGDVTSDYEMSVQFNETQPEIKPPADWIKFSPQEFNLEPGKSQEVKVTLTPASSAKPGDYFAYLEAHPIKKDATGNTVIQIAAATKLHFKIVPANIFQRIWYFLLGVWQRHKLIILAILVVALAFLFGWLNKKYFKIEIRRKA